MHEIMKRLRASRSVLVALAANPTTIMSRSLLPFVAVVAPAIFPLNGLAAAAAPRPPNIIVLLTDDQGIMDTSVPFLTDESGRPKRYPLNEFFRTPNMERLAARGIRFNNFYAMSVCSPSRVSLMTGQNSARHHVTNWIHPLTNNAGPHGPAHWNWNGLTKDDVTLPSLLKKAGYRTIAVGKGHFGPYGSEGGDPRNLGFDINIAGWAWGSPATYYGEKNYGNAGGAANPLDRAGERVALRRAGAGEVSRHTNPSD